MLVLLLSLSCGGKDDVVPNKEEEGSENGQTVKPVTDLTAEKPINRTN